MTRAFFLLFFLMTTCLPSYPQGTSTLLSVNDGLSQGMVFNILESSDGFLWIATKDGLNRYDGYRFEVFAPDAFDPFSVGASEIRTLFEDPRGWLWLCYNGGIDFFFPETGRSCHLPLPADRKFDGYVNSFALLPGGTMWLECQDLLWKIDATQDILQKANASGQAFPDIKYSVLDTPEGLLFNAVIFTKKQTLLAATSNGIYRIEQQGGMDRLLPEALPGLSVHFIGEDKSGWLWLRSDDVLWVQKNSGLPFEKVCPIASPDWLFDREGNLWERRDGTLRKWLPANLAAGGSPSLEVPVTSASKVNQTYYFTDTEIDRSGNAWVGTSGYGVVKINLAKPKFTSYLPLTSHQMAYEDPAGNIFTVREPRVLFPGRQFDRSRPNPLLEKFPPSKEILAFAFDKKGNGWVKCTGRELYRIDARTKEPVLFKTTGYGLLCTGKGQLLNVSAGALHSLDPETGRETAYPFGKSLSFNYDTGGRNHFFYEDSGGNIWIYAFEGLLKATPADGGYHFEHLKNDPADRSSLSNNFVLSVAEDPLEPGRYLWVGTKGSGLNRLDLATGTFKHFTTGESLPDNVVYGILAENKPLKGEARGWLWLSTNKGLCRFDVREGTVKNFTAADGLQDNEFNTSSYMKTRDGTMIFGGVNGLTVFHPDSLRFNQRKPRTVLTRLWVNNAAVHFRQQVPAGEGAVFLEKKDSQSYRLELSHHQNLVTIEFAALEFTNAARNQYRYQLVRHHIFGQDKGEDWVELGARNSIQFANLQPGSYIFSVLGSNNDGIFGEQAAVLEFTIHPPWWASWWAYLLYALALAAAIWSLYRYQLRRKLEYEETLRLKELDEFKNRFFTNITHEFRTPLTVILGNLEIEKLEIEKQSSQFPISQFLISKNSITRRNAENLLRLINQILDLAKLESNTLKLNYVQGDVLPYLRYIAESLHSLANAQNVMLRVESNETSIVMDYDQERLLQIVYNLLSNAIKFTPSGGRVTLRAGLLNLEGLVNLGLTVSDTGTGIPPEDLPHIFDRFFQAGNSPANPVSTRSTDRTHEGTGIGLALTKELVKAMGGKISVKSEIGKGTAFEVVLPINNKAALTDLALPPPLTPKGEPHLQNTALSPPELTTEPPGRGSPLRVRGGDAGSDDSNPSILLIEDNPDVVEYLISCLGEAYQLDFAYNGRAGIEKALETVPDLIVSDVMMPEKDGFEVCETLKNDERTSHIPIVLLTAKAGVESRIAGLKRGADAYLAKPFHREELLMTLKNLLELRKKLQTKYSDWKMPAPPGVAVDSSAQSPVTNHQSPITDPEDAFVQKVKTVIADRLSDSSFTVEDLGRALALSQRQLHRKLTALTGQSAAHLIRSMRLARAKELLLMKEKNVSEVAWEVGFDDPKYFSRIFTEEFGVPPSKI